MLPDKTTTIGEGESVATESPFQSMNAVERMRAKLRTCVRSWRGWTVERESIFLGGEVEIEIGTDGGRGGGVVDDGS